MFKTALFAAIASITVSGLALADTLAPIDEMSDGWNTIAPGGNTMCAMGTPYTFHVKPGARENVMVFLNGGGACWSGQNCDASVEPTTYVPMAELPHNDPRTRGGAFAQDNPENPFSAWTQVFVSYCTGDVHLGANDKTYTKPDGSEVTIHHRGKANTMSALGWLFDNVQAPEKVFVSGGSAGAVSSPVYAGIVQEAYPEAEVIQFAGGAGGYRVSGNKDLNEALGIYTDLPEWPAMRSLSAETSSFDDFYVATASQFPQIKFRQFNTAYDAVQKQFLTLLGSDSEVYPLLQANLDDLATEIGNFRSFTASGTFHTLLRFDEMYEFEAEGVRAVDWVRDVASGQDVASVTCAKDEAGCGGPAE